MDFNFTLEGLAMSNCWVILFEKFFAREAFLMRSHMKGLIHFERDKRTYNSYSEKCALK